MEKEIKSYKDLIVWQKAIELVKEVYKATKRFPSEELYGLTNQMRRASVSIASNIAEGKARQSRIEYAKFLYMSAGSVAELETQIIISKELGYVEQDEESSLLKQAGEISKMLRSLISKLKPRT